MYLDFRAEQNEIIEKFIGEDKLMGAKYYHQLLRQVLEGTERLRKIRDDRVTMTSVDADIGYWIWCNFEREGKNVKELVPQLWMEIMGRYLLLKISDVIGGTQVRSELARRGLKEWLTFAKDLQDSGLRMPSVESLAQEILAIERDHFGVTGFY